MVSAFSNTFRLFMPFILCLMDARITLLQFLLRRALVLLDKRSYPTFSNPIVLLAYRFQQYQLYPAESKSGCVVEKGQLMLSLTSRASLLLLWKPFGRTWVFRCVERSVATPLANILEDEKCFTGWLNGKLCLWTGHVYREQDGSTQQTLAHIQTHLWRSVAVLVSSAQNRS